MTKTSQLLPVSMDIDYCNSLEAFLNGLQKEPNAKEIKVNKYAGNSRYLPITHLEMQLDEYFFGLWTVENVKWERIANEVCVSLDLKVFHPIAKTWITRSGVGAAMIQFSKDSDMMDMNNKIKNTLVKDFPHAKAQAFRNAAQSLGKLFGRDLNREEPANYEPIVDKVTKAEKRVMQMIDAAETREDILGLDIPEQFHYLIEQKLKEL